MNPLFCELFRHWPTPLRLRRRGRVDRCWLCDGQIVQESGSWVLDNEDPPT